LNWRPENWVLVQSLVAYYLQDEARSNAPSSNVARGGRWNPALPNLAS